MNWRDVLIGGLVTLAVTVVAGLLVWFLTRTPNISEQLKFEVQAPTRFEASQNKLSIFSVKISNFGNKAASDIIFIAKFQSDIAVQETTVRSSAGPLSNLHINSNDRNAIELTLQSLAPQEVITISSLVLGLISVEPEISLRSKEAVGTAGFPAKDGEKLSRPQAFIVIIFAVTLQIVAYFWLIYNFPGFVFKIVRRFNLNNTAFLFLHNGLQKEAETLLRRQIFRWGTESISFANLGLARGLNNDAESAQKLFQIAEQWAKSKREKATLYFNQFALAVFNSDYGRAEEFLKKSLDTHKKTTLWYSKLSCYASEAKEQSSTIKELYLGAQN